MKKLLKSRFLAATLLFSLLQIVGGLLVAAPFLVFLRLPLEHSGLARGLWPAISPEIIGELLINNIQVLLVCSVAAAVIYVAYFPLKILFTAAVYDMIIVKSGEQTAGEASMAEHLKQAVAVWPGFVKTELFGIPIYITAIFLGIAFGGIAGRLAGFLRPTAILLFALIGSSYLQILRIRMVIDRTSSLRDSIRNTKKDIAGSLGRIILGNISVAAVGLLIIMLPWSLLKWTRGMEWSLLSASFSLVCQQIMVLLVNLAQALRINFNHSVLRKGE